MIFKIVSPSFRLLCGCRKSFFCLFTWLIIYQSEKSLSEAIQYFTHIIHIIELRQKKASGKTLF